MFLGLATGLQSLSSFPLDRLESDSRWPVNCHRSLEEERQHDEAKHLFMRFKNKTKHFS